MSISDINDQPVAIRDIRNSPRDTQYLPRHHAQPEINQRIPLHSNELIVHEQNFNERPPPVIPRDGHFNKAQSNQYFRKNTINNPRVSHYQNDRQPHSSSRPERQESYRDYKLRKEQAERIARAKNQTNRTVPSRNSQHLNEESSSSLSSNLITAFEPSSSSSSNLITALEPILSEFQMNFVATSNESIINEPVEVAQPPPLEMAQSLPMEMVQSLPMEMVQPSPLEMTQSPLLEMDDDFFKTIIPQLDESYIRTYREIKEETGFEILPPDEETFTEECPVENANNEIQPFVKQEPEEHFSNMDENTADFIEHYQIIKAEPIDRQSITFQ